MAKDLPAASFLPVLLAAAAGAVPLEAHADAPTIGLYVLHAELGRGASGVVYLAEQRAPVRRRVALKVAHHAEPDEATRQQLGRERQALADARHDGVVRLIDAGTTTDGRAWLSMEHVEGEPLDAFCRHHALTTGARLRLLASVARATDHLHQRGIVHRDLKPENVLVVEQDGRPVARIIDLGFAARTADATNPAHVAGTPAYIAPEHLASPTTRPDARTDVYALGVILHELLTGTPAAATPRQHGNDILLLGRHRPDKPSACVARDDLCSLRAAIEQRTTTGKLARLLARSGLDDLVVTSLSRNRDERPPTAAAFADTLEQIADRIDSHSRKRRTLMTIAITALASLAAGLLL